jgi:extracellular elastinolytic metalloproteinase
MKAFRTHCFLLLALFSFALAQAQPGKEAPVLQLVKKEAHRLGLSASEVDNSIVSSSYVDARTTIQYVYLQQGWQGVKVFNSIKSILFRDNELLYHSGRFVQDIAGKAGNAQPALQPEAAVTKAAAHLGLPAPAGLTVSSNRMATEKKVVLSSGGIAKKEIEAELYWVATDAGAVRLAWNINIDVLGKADWWNVRVDALTGEVLEKDNWTVHERHHDEEHEAGTSEAVATPAQLVDRLQHRFYAPPTVTSAGYRVIGFPTESPRHGALSVSNQPWLLAGTTNPATTNGWHFDGVNNYNITRGNNVFAYLDVLNNNTPGPGANWADTSTTNDPVLSFLSTANFNQEPAEVVNRKAAITNLFYWNNIIHDITYQYGFTEVAGNFQADNLGRGGISGDFVQAEAQDASGTNNANFATPADGSRPRMQMFLFNAVPSVNVSAPASIAGQYISPESNFSTANKLVTVGPVSGQVVFYNDNAAGTLHEACAAPVNSVTGKIAFIDRGTCGFTIKVKNAQDAGAIGVIVRNNVPGSPIIMGGTDNTITIPAVMVSQEDGALIANQLAINATVNATLTAGVKLDGDFDNGIIVHEYGHGVSNRLTGGPGNASCLGNSEQGGEGWSDYLALMLTTNWSTAQLTDGSRPRPMGTYAAGQATTGSGIRTRPYSTDLNINNLHYGNLASNTQVHFIGEVWCSAIWDMTWNIIQQTGSIEPNLYNSNSNAGNVVALRLVMEGMRLQTCRPGFLDARDAILAADSILYNGAYKCAIWNAFARRGMGFSAIQGLSSSASDQVEAFDVPTGVTLSKTTSPVSVQSGGEYTMTLSASCQCAVPTGSFTLRDTIPAGFSYVSSSAGGTLNGNVVTFSNVNFTAAQQTRSFTVTFRADAPGCAIDTAINDNRNGSTIGSLTPSSLSGGSTNWLTSSARFRSPSGSWQAPNPGSSQDFVLSSSGFQAGPLSVLSFWQYYVVENTIDGGRVELSADGGNTWIDAGPYMVQNGYNKRMTSASPWGEGSTAFSGVSFGQANGQFIHTLVNLSPFAGQTVMIRLRMRTNGSNAGGYEGWFVDDILMLNGCGGMIKAGLYNSTNAKVDSTALPLFIRPGANPAPAITTQPQATAVCVGANASFTVAASSPAAPSYQWQVSVAGGAFTNISGATSATLSLNGVTAGMSGNAYRCVVTNSNGSVTSNSAQLTVNGIPATGTVGGVAVCAGANATFSVSTPAGLSYQWQLSTDNGNTFANVAGATASTLAVNNVTAAQQGHRYRVVVSNSCGGTTWAAGTLTVNAAPAVVVLNPPASLCTSDGAVQLSATPAGGTWSGTGMTGDRFSPAGLAAGSYPVTYTVTDANGCTGSASANLTVSVCANTQLTLDADGAITLYPNPNNGRFFIRINSSLYNRLALRIYGSEGRLVHQRSIGSGAGSLLGHVERVNLPSLAAGVYQLRLLDEASGKAKTFQLRITH